MTTPTRHLYCRQCGERYPLPPHTFDGTPCVACALLCPTCAAAPAAPTSGPRVEPLVVFEGAR